MKSTRPISSSAVSLWRAGSVKRTPSNPQFELLVVVCQTTIFGKVVSLEITTRKKLTELAYSCAAGLWR